MLLTFLSNQVMNVDRELFHSSVFTLLVCAVKIILTIDQLLLNVQISETTYVSLNGRKQTLFSNQMDNHCYLTAVALVMMDYCLVMKVVS